MGIRSLLIPLCITGLAACAGQPMQPTDRGEVMVMPQLEVGKIYRAEDGRTTYRYSGEGKLEKWGLERYFTPDSPKK